MYCDSAQIARAVFDKLRINKVNAVLVTGELTKAEKEQAISLFRTGAADVMVGTASMATGTDGIDKVCDTLIIVDDTQDDSLRRQLIGRILPRGTDTDASVKGIYRLVFSCTRGGAGRSPASDKGGRDGTEERDHSRRYGV